nr:copia protein [Tanacetum cinerariifolium]
MALTEAMKEAIWLRGLLEDLGVELNRVTVNCDNQGAIHLSRNHVFHERTKHINVRYHFIREVLDAKTVKVLKVGTEHNVADALTKVIINGDLVSPVASASDGAEDGICGYDWSFQDEEELTNFTLMSYTSQGSSSSSSLDFEGDNQVNDRFKKGEGYHAVPPPYTGNYMPPRADLYFVGLDNSVFKSKESDSEDENVFKPKEVKKTVKPSLEKIKFVNARNTTVENKNKAKIPRKFSQSPRGNKRNWNGLMTQKLRDGFEFKNKACFVCGSINHLIKDCDFYKNKMILNNKGKIIGPKEIRPVWDNTAWVNHQNKLTHPHPKRNFVLAAVLKKSGQVPVNAAKQSSHRAASSVSVARHVNTDASRLNMNNALPTTYSYFKAHSPVRRPFNQKLATKTNNFNAKVNTAKGNPQYALQHQRIFDSRCSRHMTRNKSYLTGYQKIDGGFVAFGGNAKGGTKANIDIGQAGKKTVLGPQYVLLPLLTFDFQDLKSSENEVADDAGKKSTEVPRKENEIKDPAKEERAQRNKFESMFEQEKDANGNRMFTPVSTAGSTYDNADLQDTGIFSGSYDDEVEGAVANFNNLELTTVVSPILTTRIHKDYPKEQIIGDPFSTPQTRRMTKTSQEHAMVYRNKKYDKGIVVRNKARLVAHSYTQEEGIDYDEVFAHVARIEAIRRCMCANLLGLKIYIPNKVYKVEKALYGLHQASKAWYETLSTYLLENRFRKGIIDKTLFIKKDKGDLLLVQVYVDDIIFGSTKKSLCTEIEGLMHKKFQMSSMGELTFFLGLQVMQKDDGIFISQDKYVADILKKFDFSSVKTASTPIETNKALLKDEEAKDVDVYLYRSMIGSLMYLTSSRPDIIFVVCVCARFQVTPKVSHLYAMKRIFRYLKCQPKLGLCLQCIEQFWATAKVKNVNREAQIQALVDKKKVIITEASIRRDLRFEDEGGVDCLSNEVIFEQLTFMGYEKLSQKITFYKAFFSHQWKFLIHTILQCLSAKTTAWNEFSSTMASAIICLATNKKFNFSKYIFDNMVKHLDGEVKILMYPRFVQVFFDNQVEGMDRHNAFFVISSHTKKVFANMKREEKDFFEKVTPLFEIMMKKQKSRRKQRKEIEVPSPSSEIPNEEGVPITSNDPLHSGEDRMQLNELMILCTNLQKQVLDLEEAKTAQAKEIASLKKRVKKLEQKKKPRTSGLKRLRRVGSVRRVESSTEASLGKC